MKRISDLSHRQLKGIQFLLTDIDDTMTEDGLLPSSSLSAIERLDNVGIAVLPITGRPAGWCDHIARMWSVKAVVGENGAFYFSYDHSTCRMVQVFAKNEHERERDRARLCQIKDRILKEVPGAGVASDQNYRVLQPAQF